MDFEMEIQAKNMYKFDDFEYEDDVFYSELRRQVLQLTAEDDEEDVDVAVYKSKNMNTNNVVAAAKKGNSDGCRQGGYYDWPPSKEEAFAPAWIMNLWRSGNGNGTGVFIPQIVQSKKKNRPRRKRSERGRANRNVERI